MLESKKAFQVDDLDLDANAKDFSLEPFMSDRYSTTDSTVLSASVPEDTVALGRLSRMIASDRRSQSDDCEGYLEKKSPAIFIKWQVRYYESFVHVSYP